MKKSRQLGAVCACVITLAGAPAFGVPAYDITTIGLTDAEHTRSDNYRISAPISLNEAGQAVGLALRYYGATDAGRSAWFYNGTTTLNIGLTDAGHTRSTDNYRYSYVNFLNEAGQAVGYASRFNDATDTGQSAWLYNGTTTLNIGLTDAGHTRNDGYQFSQANGPNLLNEAGQVVGYAARFNGATDTGQSAWLYNGTTTLNIGLTDAGHTRSTDNYRYSYVKSLNEAGQVVGGASSFNGAAGTGQSAWLYNGTTTLNIGLTDAGHTRSTDNYRHSNVGFLNEAGQVVGTAALFNGAAGTGQSAWFYGTTTHEIGLTDAGHTRSTDNYRYSSSDLLNEAGQAVGFAFRYNGATDTGQSAWLYNGTTTHEIGLTDAGHTRNDGYQYNRAIDLNDAGQAIGYTNRYNGATDTGETGWFYNGTTTYEIGLTDEEHTRNDGYQANYAHFMNEAGQAVGYAARYNGATDTGQTAWYYDSTIDQTYSMDWYINPNNGYAWSFFTYLGDDGLGLGSYTLFDTAGNSLGNRAFSFTVNDGFQDLGSLVADLSSDGWQYLANAIHANGAGQISGQGLLADMTSGRVAYLLTPQAVPVPAAVWLFGSGLLGSIGVARRKRQTHRG